MGRFERVALLSLFVACSEPTVIVGHFDLADAGTSRDRPAAQPKPYTIEQESWSQFCAGSGSALRSDDCVPLERRLFSYALCACGDVQLEGEQFAVDAFDSRQGAYAPGQGGAAVGVNGSLVSNASEVQIGGSLIVAGSNTFSISSDRFAVRGDLKARPALAANNLGVRIARDAWFAGDVRAPGPASITVGRDAYLHPNARGAELLRGNVRTSEFTIAPPCACGAAAPLDVPAIVAMAKSSADNDAAGISRDLLSNLSSPIPVFLPCGRFVLSELVAASGAPSVIAMGRTALFIEGSVSVSAAAFTLVAGEGAELDVYVAGDLTLTGATIVLGHAMRPRALRIYVGGQVHASSLVPLAAQIYAPNASLSNVVNETYGSLFVGSLGTILAARLHFDRAVVDAPASCQAAAPSCQGCDGCTNGLACVDGSCAACTLDSDCCEPFSCVEGRCKPLLTPEP